MYNTISDNQESEEVKLEEFFLLLKRLNKSEPIDKQLIQEISSFISFRSIKNKNQFLDDVTGLNLLN